MYYSITSLRTTDATALGPSGFNLFPLAFTVASWLNTSPAVTSCFLKMARKWEAAGLHMNRCRDGAADFPGRPVCTCKNPCKPFFVSTWLFPDSVLIIWLIISGFEMMAFSFFLRFLCGKHNSIRAQFWNIFANLSIRLVTVYSLAIICLSLFFSSLTHPHTYCYCSNISLNGGAAFFFLWRRKHTNTHSHSH